MTKSKIKLLIVKFLYCSLERNYFKSGNSPLILITVLTIYTHMFTYIQSNQVEKKCIPISFQQPYIILTIYQIYLRKNKFHTKQIFLSILLYPITWNYIWRQLKYIIYLESSHFKPKRGSEKLHSFLRRVIFLNKT